MDSDEPLEKEATRTGIIAASAFLKVEVLAYMALGVLLALATLMGIGSAAASLWTVVQAHGSTDAIVGTIDQLLFVLMLVEILHTVGVSFRSGILVCEPFLIVGLIASIRRVLVITLKSSQTNTATPTPEARSMLNSTMLELGVLAAVILVMVISITMLRRSEAVRDR